MSELSLLWNYPQMNVNGPVWWYVSIGSGNGLVPDGTKPLPEPMLTQISVAQYDDPRPQWVNLLKPGIALQWCQYEL